MTWNAALGDGPLHDRRAYRLGPRPLGLGGQAEVFPGEHRATGTQIAFKRRLSLSVEAVARMQREIEFGRLLDGNRHIVPILDYGKGHDWFVMPRAKENAAEARSALADDDALMPLVLAVCSALEVAHRAGWVHRDLKPANLLWLDDRWMVADWGLGRRPRGDTTFSGRTTKGELYGTVGFAAPEQAIDAHATTASADFYSLGQIIGWARTAQLPVNGTPLVPADEPWRSVVVAATRANPSDRPQDAHAFRQLLGAV